MTDDERVRELLTKVIGFEQFTGRDDLLAQVEHVRVAGGPVTFLELAVDPTAPRSDVGTGVVSVTAWVHESGDDVGTLIVWVDGGYISALEFAWFTDEPPTSLPSPAQLRGQ